MDKKYIQENEIDIKYLRGQLADDELELFEIYLMENPEFVEGLRMDGILLGHAKAVEMDKGLNLTVFNSSWLRKVLIVIPATCAIILTTGSVVTSISLNRGGSELILFATRSTDSTIPKFNRTFGQKVWPFRQDFLLRAQVANSRSMTHVVVEKLELTNKLYKNVFSSSELVHFKNGDVGTNIDLTLLRSGEYRVTYLLDSSENESSSSSNWIFYFQLD